MINTKILHILSVELFAAVLLVRTIWLWRNSTALLKRYGKTMSRVSVALFLAGIIPGLQMYADIYSFHTPFWLQLKFVCLLVSMLTGIIGSIKSDKYFLLVSVLFNLFIIVVANLKPL